MLSVKLTVGRVACAPGTKHDHLPLSKLPNLQGDKKQGVARDVVKFDKDLVGWEF
jgi:hypothetical protein